MNSIPNEILGKILDCLGKEDIPKVRLVSSRFNLLGTEFVQKLYEVTFEEESEIAKFVTMFQNKAVIPFERFGFYTSLLAKGLPLEQFCAQFGKIVKQWNVFGVPQYRRMFWEGYLSKNLQILLESCINVEEIDSVTAEEIGKFTSIPELRNLKALTIESFDAENKHFIPVLNQIFQKAPNLRDVSIRRLLAQMSSDAILADVLNQLYNMNGAVLIRRLFMNLELPLSNVNDLSNLAVISTKCRILQLDSSITVRGDHPDRLRQTMEILSQLIQNLKSVRKLTLECCDLRNHNDSDRPYTTLTLPLRSPANLKYLSVHNLAVGIPVVPGQQTEFPVLTTLICRYEEDIYNFGFSGCVFPNVKSAEICLKTEEECEEWPKVLPNVEKLVISCKTLKGIFRFPKLSTLDITIHSEPSSDDCSEVRKQHWHHLSGGAPYDLEWQKRICSFPLDLYQTSDSIDSFRNLPLLRKLTFDGDTIECWNGIIYASGTGQLRRLQKLRFGRKDFSEKQLYLTELMKYHDSVSYLIWG